MLQYQLRWTQLLSASNEVEEQFVTMSISLTSVGGEPALIGQMISKVIGYQLAKAHRPPPLPSAFRQIRKRASASQELPADTSKYLRSLHGIDKEGLIKVINRLIK